MSKSEFPLVFYFNLLVSQFRAKPLPDEDFALEEWMKVHGRWLDVRAIESLVEAGMALPPANDFGGSR